MCCDAFINQRENKCEQDACLDPQSRSQWSLANYEMSEGGCNQIQKRRSETDDHKHDEKTKRLWTVSWVTLSEGGVRYGKSECNQRHAGEPGSEEIQKTEISLG